MSDENTEVTTEVTETPQEEPKPVSKEEARARQNGWVGRDEWVEMGRDPNDHVPAKFFNQKGDLISQVNQAKSSVNSLKKEMDERLKANNEFHKVNLETRLAELQNNKRAAVEDGNFEQVESINKQEQNIANQINNLNAQVAIDPQLQEAANYEQNWINNNSWFNDNSPKGVYARTIAQDFMAKGLRGEDVINAIEKEISIHYPAPKETQVNENRENAGVTDRVAPKSGKAKEVLTMSSLTATERNIAQALMNNGHSEEDVLKMAKDARK